MIQTLLIIVVSLGLGAGSTLLMQTLVVTPAPVMVAVACPGQRTAEEQAMIDRALEPLEGTTVLQRREAEVIPPPRPAEPIEPYVPQGRLLRGLRTGKEQWQ